MDMYGVSVGQESFPVDDFLDLSNEEIFSADSEYVCASGNYNTGAQEFGVFHQKDSGSFTADDICVPNDDVEQLEWLSTFVEDSFTYSSPSNSSFPTATNVAYNTSSSHGRPLTKRSRSKSITNHHVSSPDQPTEGIERQCSHCLSVKTPQWRAGPMGPKTLCNACGVRYKSGRLVPEYRPASSPTFILTQHSNSHRKVMELRRQKETMMWQQRQQQQQQQQHNDQVLHQYSHHDHDHPPNFEVY